MNPFGFAIGAGLLYKDIVAESSTYVVHDNGLPAPWWLDVLKNVEPGAFFKRKDRTSRGAPY